MLTTMDKSTIKQALFKRHSYDIQTERDIYDEAFDKIPDSEFVRKTIDNEEEIDNNCIFGRIDDVISFLQKAKEEGYDSVCEGWSGYEDNYFYLTKKGKENNDAYLNRLWNAVKNNVYAIGKHRLKIKKRNDEIARLEAEIARLKREC